MKTAIGIRTKPDVLHYCVLSEYQNSFEINVLDKINLPKSLSIPEQLKFVRSTLMDIMNENQVLTACIRITESNAQTVNTKRVYIEGVVQELLASSPVHQYFAGQISSISSRLNIDRKDFKPTAEGTIVFKGIHDWEKWDLESRESVLVAFAAINL
ncbi:MAG: hypothetical protein ACOH13_04590 [Flavobacteriales bacterium]